MTGERSSSVGAWILVVHPPCRDGPRVGEFERGAADGVHGLDAAIAGGGHDAFTSDLDDLSGVGEADAAGGGEDFQGTTGRIQRQLQHAPYPPCGHWGNAPTPNSNNA